MSIEQTFPLSPKSEHHKSIIQAFRARKHLAETGRGERLERWRKNEEIMLAYVPESETDEKRNQGKRAGMPQYTTIEIPYSYAMILTLHTYITSIFLTRTPVISLQGRHGEGEHSVMAMESLVDYQLTSGQNLGALYVWLIDPLRYGQGIIGHYWDVEEIAISRRQAQPRMFLGQPIEGTEEMTTVQEVIKAYEGARLYNVRPQDFMHDPRVPFMKASTKGEFLIVSQKLSWADAKRRESQGLYFSVDLVKTLVAKGGFREQGSPHKELPLDFDAMLGQERSKKNEPNYLNIHEFYWEIVPKQYGLGPGERYEKWVFTIAEETLVIGAQPLGLLHSRWPFDVLEYEIDGYGVYNRSALEVAAPLNDTLTWLFNSHYFNVRKTLNDQFFVDPSMVELRDLEDPNPGRLVRLKPAAYGKPVDSFVKQFPVVDVTKGNMQDALAVSDLMQRLLGSNDNLMGMVQQNRATATEVRSSSTNAQGRIKTVAEWFSATGFSSLSQNLVQLTQQMYDAEKKFRIVGDIGQWGDKYVNVTPEDIAGFYDFLPVDGNLPIDRFAQVNLWQQMFGSIMQIPQIAGQYDLAGIFAYVAQLAGLRNITQFRVNVMPQGMPPGMAPPGSVPIGQASNMMEPGQIPGMGPTG